MIQRPRVLRLLAVLLLTALPAGSARALQCMARSFEQKVRDAENVFVGEVLRAGGKHPAGERFTIRVVTVLKRSAKNPVGASFDLITEKWRNHFGGRVGELWLFFGTSWLCAYPIRLR